MFFFVFYFCGKKINDPKCNGLHTVSYSVALLIIAHVSNYVNKIFYIIF